MPFRRTFHLVTGILLASSYPVVAQNAHTLGLNVHVSSSTRVGVTWQLQRSLALRPSAAFSWSSREQPTASGTTTTTLTQTGLDLDLLVNVASHEAFTSYLGLGGFLGGRWTNGEGEVAWEARTFVGLRLEVLKRIALFSELGVQYTVVGAGGAKALSLSTEPLGVLIYLN